MSPSVQTSNPHSSDRHSSNRHSTNSHSSIAHSLNPHTSSPLPTFDPHSIAIIPSKSVPSSLKPQISSMSLDTTRRPTPRSSVVSPSSHVSARERSSVSHVSTHERPSVSGHGRRRVEYRKSEHGTSISHSPERRPRSLSQSSVGSPSKTHANAQAVTTPEITTTVQNRPLQHVEPKCFTFYEKVGEGGITIQIEHVNLSLTVQHLFECPRIKVRCFKVKYQHRHI